MYALIHNNKIVVGPRDWNKAFFSAWLDKNDISDSYAQDQVPIYFNENTRLVRVEFSGNPDGFNPKIHQLAGPYYVIQDDVVLASYETAPLPLAVVRGRLKEIVAENRYNKEVGGIEVNGTRIMTDRESQSKIQGAWVTCQINPSTMINWKGENGWVFLNRTAVEAIASAVSMHVQDCFNKEKAKIEEIDSTFTLHDLDQIELVI